MKKDGIASKKYSRNSSRIGKSGNSDDERARIVVEEIMKFKKLMKGHEKLLKAIASL